MHELDLGKKVGRTSFLCVAVFATFGLARAQTQPGSKTMESNDQRMSGMMDECKSMMSAREQRKNEMEDAQAKLDALVKEMHAADGDAKLKVMEKVVTELVSRRKSMMSEMMLMEPRMMQHLMRHTKTAMQDDDAAGMACPMMRSIGASGGASADHEPGSNHARR